MTDQQLGESRTSVLSSAHTISVVIPVKDDAAQLRRCLMALVPQLGAHDEVIVVDNASTDDSAAVGRDFGARVVFVEGGGIPAAAAAGYDAATSSLVARLDADCVPAADWLARIRMDFEFSPELVGVTGGALFLDGPRALRRSLALAYLGAYFTLLAPALGHVPLFGSNCAFRRSAWSATAHEVHRDDPYVHDDLDLAFHLGPQRVIRFDPKLRMQMSMRPFFDLRSFVRRFDRGFHTVAIHWPHSAPYRRWSSRWGRQARETALGPASGPIGLPQLPR